MRVSTTIVACGTILTCAAGDAADDNHSGSPHKRGSPTTLEDLATRGPWSGVRAFGAMGDGVTDDTAAIRAAVEFARGRQAVVYFAPGAYRITKSLQLPPNVTLQGVGIGFGSQLRPVNTDAITIHGKDYEGGYGFRNRIRGLTVV